MADLPSPAACRALLNPNDPGSGTIDGQSFNAWWRGASPADRRGWVEYAAGFGVVPEGYVEYSLGLPPSMMLAPGAFCYRVLALEESGEAGGGGGATQPQEGREDGGALDYQPTQRGFVVRVVEWLRDLLSRAVQFVSDALRSVVETIRNLVDGIAGAAGSLALWLGLGLALILGLYLATRNGGRARRGR
jgi:hypothetical protein